MRYNTVIFDLDGTLLNTLDDLHNATNYALMSLGYPERTLEEVRQFVGNGAGELMRRAVPDGIDSTEALKAFHAYYSQHSNERTAAYPGIPDLLENLSRQGVKLAVVSNKPHPQVVELCQTYFGQWITHACGDREGVRRKPAPDTVLAVMQELGADPQSTLYVGDSDVDIHTAQNTGVDGCGVLWGFRDKGVLEAAGATKFASTAQELFQLIQG